MVIKNDFKITFLAIKITPIISNNLDFNSIKVYQELDDSNNPRE